MGCFSWMYADTGNKENLRIGEEAFVPCPDGTVLHEPSYGGYGCFAGKDIYELVVEWNRDDLHEGLLRKPLPEQWRIKGDGTDSEESLYFYESALNRYDAQVLFMNDISNGMSDEELKDKYSWDDRTLHDAIRIFGIEIACYDEQNEALKYPIKVCKEIPESYDALPASKGDPNQGFF